MRYEVVFPSSAGSPRAPIEVELKELPSGEIEAYVRGRKVEIDALSLDRGLSVRIDGHMVDLVTEGELPEIGVVSGGHRSYVQVTSDRLRAALAAKSGRAGANEKTVKSPMPGRVVKLMVAVGDEVQAGQGLIIVEAMKMENELKAKAAGKVAAVHVKALDTVENGAKLITLE